MYKRVLNYAAASHAAGTKINFVIAVGIDSISNNQSGPTDTNVPTGNIIDYVEIQYGAINLAAVACFVHTSMQVLLTGQTATVAPNVVGGNPQRNQVFHQEMRSLGQGQNATFVYKWRVPKHIRRLKEGMTLAFTVLGTAATTDSCQIIYRTKE